MHGARRARLPFSSSGLTLPRVREWWLGCPASLFPCSQAGTRERVLSSMWTVMVVPHPELFGFERGSVPSLSTTHGQEFLQHAAWSVDVVLSMCVGAMQLLSPCLSSCCADSCRLCVSSSCSPMDAGACTCETPTHYPPGLCEALATSLCLYRACPSWDIVRPVVNYRGPPLDEVLSCASLARLWW